MSTKSQILFFIISMTLIGCDVRIKAPQPLTQSSEVPTPTARPTEVPTPEPSPEPSPTGPLPTPPESCTDPVLPRTGVKSWSKNIKLSKGQSTTFCLDISGLRKLSSSQGLNSFWVQSGLTVKIFQQYPIDQTCDCVGQKDIYGYPSDFAQCGFSQLAAVEILKDEISQPVTSTNGDLAVSGYTAHYQNFSFGWNKLKITNKTRCNNLVVHVGIYGNEYVTP